MFTSYSIGWNEPCINSADCYNLGDYNQDVKKKQIMPRAVSRLMGFVPWLIPLDERV